MNQRKTLEIMWVNVKVGEKLKEKAFMEKLKTFVPKKTVQLPTLLQLYPGQVCSTTPHKPLKATQTFDDDQTPPMSWINITKTNMK